MAADAFLDNLDDVYLAYPTPEFMWRIATVYLADRLGYDANLYDAVQGLTYHQQLITEVATGTPNDYAFLRSAQSSKTRIPRDKQDIEELERAIALWTITHMPHPLILCSRYCSQSAQMEQATTWAGDSGFLIAIVARAIGTNSRSYSAYQRRAADDRSAEAGFENGILMQVIGDAISIGIAFVPGGLLVGLLLGAVANAGLASLPPIISTSYQCSLRKRSAPGRATNRHALPGIFSCRESCYL